MKVAVEGCCHGELDAIYAQIALLERKHGYSVDLLLICGDFQAMRNHADLQCMAVPDKYRQLGGFYKYYVGEETAPVLTVVIGGNHEASNYFWELYHGGWLAPNIYFLGFAGCVQVNGVRIAGASGIYKLGDYALGHHERVPYDKSTIRSIYHVRQYDIFKLAQLSPPTIFLSHDWPNTIEHHGDTAALFRRKPFFRTDSENGALGSPPLLALLRSLRPHWWFAAHMHVRFDALFRHVPARHTNPDEINIEDDPLDDDAPAASSDSAQNQPPPNPIASGPAAETRFFALDKCLPKRDYLQVLDIPALDAEPGEPQLTFDAEWLAITRALHPFLSTSRTQTALPSAEKARAAVDEARTWVQENVSDLAVAATQTFVRTAPGPGPGQQQGQQPCWYTNPQTEAFAQLLGVENKVNPPPPV